MQDTSRETHSSFFGSCWGRPGLLVPELSGREGRRPAAAGQGALRHKVTPRGLPEAAQEDRNPLGHHGSLVPPTTSSPHLPPSVPPSTSLIPKLDFLGAKRLWFTLKKKKKT